MEAVLSFGNLVEWLHLRIQNDIHALKSIRDKIGFWTGKSAPVLPLTVPI